MPSIINLPGILESFVTKRSRESSGDDIGHVKFPLMISSKDNFSALNTKTVGEYLEEDFISYLRLLQLASLEASELEIQNPPLPTITPEKINRRDQSQGAAILHYACMNGHQQIVHHLLEQGADVDCPDENKQVTPLMCAAAFGHLDIVELLVERHCDIDAGLQGQSTALLWAIRGSHSEIVSFLLDQKASQISTNLYSETTIHAAVICGSPEILETLLDASSAHSSVDLHFGIEKITPLHLAASGKYQEGEALCKILLEQGNADVKSLNSTNKTPLHLAAASQKPDIVKLLLSYSAPVNVTDDMGRTPLFYAVGDSEGSLRCLQALIQHGNSEVNHQDIHGYTPLHLAGQEGYEEAAEVLLVNGADFSIKAYSGGGTALSILRRKIPDTVSLLRNAFDKAVTVVTSPQCINDGRRDTTVKVNFRFVLPAPNCLNDVCAASLQDVDPASRRKNSRWSRFTDSFLEDDTRLCTRKETSKIKCLVDEEHECLLLHPVIHSFLELKWEKARKIFFPVLFFKVLLVMLFSLYILLPYSRSGQRMLTPAVMATATSSGNGNSTTTTTPPTKILPEIQVLSLVWYYVPMWVAIVVMAAIKGLMELAHVLRSPKTQLKTVHPYISIAVLALICYLRPKHWFENLYNETWNNMAALGILLAWVDIWIDMGRFPKMGLSIRVFFQVLKNFFRFILPHTFLLAGFFLSFSIIFRQHPEFASVMLSLSKIIRIIAGDITIVQPEGQRSPSLLQSQSPVERINYLLIVYIYTAYVLIVAIVLGNMLIGLAANDMQAIYSGASIDKLKRQTMLLNTLESNFVRSWMPTKFIDNHINLFGPSSPHKVLVFDSRDSKLSPEQKKELLDIDSDNAKAATLARTSSSNTRGTRQEDVVEMRMAPHKNIRIWKDVVSKLRPSIASSSRTSQLPIISVHDDEDQLQRMLMEDINKLVASYLTEKNKKPGNTLTLPRS